MKLYVSQNHRGEGKFPTFPKGTRVVNLSPCANYPNWFSCEIVGMKTYVSADFLEGNVLNRDYNPTELMVQVGDSVELLEVHFNGLWFASTKKLAGYPSLSFARHHDNEKVIVS